MKIKKILFKIFIILLSLFLFMICITIGCHNSKTTETISDQNTISDSGFQTFAVKEAYDFINNSGRFPFVLDVRTKEEFEDSHIVGAYNIPVSELEQRLNEIPKSAPIVVYCKSGTRSRQAAEILANKGFKEIYDLLGGIESWIKEGKKISKGNKTTVVINDEISAKITNLEIMEAKALIESEKELTILDVRPEEEYNDSHLKNAIRVDVTGLEKNIIQLNKNIPVLLYCSSLDCGSSDEAARILVTNGFSRVYVMDEGIEAWTLEGLPIYK